MIVYLSQLDRWEDTYWHMQPGKYRREILLALFVAFPEAKLCVNRKWCASTKDPDLHKLLKQGKIKQSRSGHKTCRHTYLQLA